MSALPVRDATPGRSRQHDGRCADATVFGIEYKRGAPQRLVLRMNIVEPVLYQCRVNPHATAIATPGAGMGSIKYGQLESLIHNVARAAIKAGLAPGDIVAIYIADPIVQAVLILGFM